MYLVDKFIAKVIHWKQDYTTYRLAGLLLSPVDVLKNMTGDCQGQAVVTASLLLSMGFDAWVVETPFHWWTHAEDPDTGLVTNLNVHGGGGIDGNVRPQPIDLIYTRPRAQCNNCPYPSANNEDPLFYMAPPHRAFAIALTGAHMVVRSGFTIDQISYTTLVGLGLFFAVVSAIYATVFQGESISTVLGDGFLRFVKRFLISSLITVFPLFFGMASWGYLYYPFSIIHALGFITFLLSYVSSDSLNETL